MDPCTLYETWDEIGPTSELLDGLQTLADSIIDAWGLEGVTVDFGELEPNDFGEYDPDTKRITIDLSNLNDPDLEDPAKEAFNTLFHECMHAALDQWELPEELDELGAQLAGDYYSSELLNSCVSTDLVESGASATIPPLPWIFGNE